MLCIASLSFDAATFVMSRSLLPVVVFCFSKKRVELLAGNLGSLDLATAAEKSEIQVCPVSPMLSGFLGSSCG